MFSEREKTPTIFSDFLYHLCLIDSYLFVGFVKISYIRRRNQQNSSFMTTFALNNLWTYLQGLALSQSDREWLANKLVMSKETKAESERNAEERKAKFLEMAGIWSETEEGEEYYQMMKHRNDGLPLNRDITLDD
jgi:nicotinic acid phosphoribosyltransferase